MKFWLLLGMIAALFSAGPRSGALAQFHVGPVTPGSTGALGQTESPIGMSNLLLHPSRVYSIWVNGNENFYYQATPEGIQELVDAFSKLNVRDHEILIKAGPQQVDAGGSGKFSYNADFHVLGGIALAMNRQKEKPETFDPTLTIYFDPNTDVAWVQQLKLPANIILSNETAIGPKQGPAIKPERKLWYVGLQFPDAKPATDFKHGLKTCITLWRPNAEGIDLGSANHKGRFHNVFSDAEIEELKTGKAWLTMSVGNYQNQPKPDDAKLEFDNFSTDPNQLKIVTVPSPGLLYGRLLFEDGTPVKLDPLPWPGAEIMIDFAFAGPVNPDAEGYFAVHLTDEQLEKSKAMKSRKNIYIPDPLESGSSTAKYEFPAALLTSDKANAGVVKISKPEAQKEPISETDK